MQRPTASSESEKYAHLASLLKENELLLKLVQEYQMHGRLEDAFKLQQRLQQNLKYLGQNADAALSGRVASRGEYSFPEGGSSRSRPTPPVNDPNTANVHISNSASGSRFSDIGERLSTEEISKIAMQMKEFGVENIEAIRSVVPHRSPTEVAAIIQYISSLKQKR